MGRLDGKVALISGGARGQGAAEAQLCAREGAKVVLGDVLDAQGQQVEADIRASGGAAIYVHLDVTREADWREAVEMAVHSDGKLDVLVNNAGIAIRTGIEDTSAEDWDRLMAVNAKGVFLGTKHAIPAMRRAGGGSIVNISSTAGLVGSPYGSAVYTASKGAVRLFTKVTAVQHAKDNRLLLDSRVVDVPMAYNPIVVTPPSWNIFCFNGLQNALRFSDAVGVKDPGIQ